MSFGENLKRARTSIGMTQAELARRTGITERSIYNYEKNSRAPKIDVVERFAQALGVQPESLMEGMGALAASSPQAKMERALRQAQDVPEASSYERLTHEKEADLMKYINEFTSVVSEAARLRAPHKVCNYIQKLAQKFHSFYNACKVIDREDMELSAQRLDLVKAARITLGNALELIGVEAPEKM